MSQEAARILPCPFCGPGNSMVSAYYCDASKRFRVGCGACGAHTGVTARKEDDSEQAAVNRWNRRTTSIVQAEIVGWLHIHPGGQSIYETEEEARRRLIVVGGALHPIAKPVNPLQHQAQWLRDALSLGCSCISAWLTGIIFPEPKIGGASYWSPEDLPLKNEVARPADGMPSSAYDYVRGTMAGDALDAFDRLMLEAEFDADYRSRGYREHVATIRAALRQSVPQKSEVDTMIFFVEALGFTHTFENGFHVVDGYGFKKDHVSMSCIINRIAGWLGGLNQKCWEEKYEQATGIKIEPVKQQYRQAQYTDGSHSREIEEVAQSSQPDDLTIAFMYGFEQGKDAVKSVPQEVVDKVREDIKQILDMARNKDHALKRYTASDACMDLDTITHIATKSLTLLTPYLKDGA